MSGAHVDDLLLALVERRLTAPERARVTAHLAQCPRCQTAAHELAETVDALKVLPGALRVMPVRAAQHWPGVWARVAKSETSHSDAPAQPRRGAKSETSHSRWPQVSVYLSLVSGFLAFLAVTPGLGRGAPASVTAGVAIGPQSTQVATVVLHAAGGAANSTGAAHAALSAAEPTLAGTEARAPIPITTPVPGP